MLLMMSTTPWYIRDVGSPKSEGSISEVWSGKKDSDCRLSFASANSSHLARAHLTKNPSPSSSSTSQLFNAIDCQSLLKLMFGHLDCLISFDLGADKGWKDLRVLG